jgi:3-hydroxyisobutyrate dehydrogenase-like beta-hydroxyacid dehydrogenase
MKVAFLGLGVMGAPMAGHLSAKGFDLTVWNRSPARSAAWAAAHKGRVATDPADAARGAAVTFTCLGDDADVEAVTAAIGDGAGPGSILVDHTTASPALARRLADAFARRGVAFVDAPVSGGQAGAEKGTLAVMCGGPAEAVSAAQQAMAAYAARIVHVGPSGHGQLCKAVNQICIAGLVEGLAEGVAFAQAAGLDIDRTFEAISGGAAQSWQMLNRMKTMAADEFEFGFAVDWMRKDLRIALTEARVNGARLPVAALVDQFYADVQQSGGGRWDTSSLVKRLRPRGEGGQ